MNGEEKAAFKAMGGLIVNLYRQMGLLRQVVELHNMALHEINEEINRMKGVQDGN